MVTHNRLVAALGVGALVLCAFGGCAELSSDPSVPPGNPAQALAERSCRYSRVLWGVWELTFDVDRMISDSVPLRSALAHYDVTEMITPPACSNCLTIKISSFDPVTGVLDADVTLRNPTKLVGHDVRGILYTNQYGHDLLNAEAWTGLFDIPEGDAINPFKAFAKTTANRAFLPQAQHMEEYVVYIPDPPHWEGITYAVDASWPSNCEEPYDISGFSQKDIYAAAGSAGAVYVDVLDWQDDVSEVVIAVPEMTGEPSTQMAHLAGNTWSVDLVNNMGAVPGWYEAWITANSGGPGSPTLHKKVEVAVIKEPKITLDPAVTYQTITGWEVTGWAGDYWEPAFDNYKDELFNRTVNEAGITRVRLEVRSGAENSTDYWTQYYNGLIDYATWRANRYATVNDNSDPFDTDESGFHFSELDFTTERIVLPLMGEMSATGESLYVNLNYVAFTGQITMGGDYHHGDPDEYAEFIVAAFNHLDQTYGFTPDAIEILLEPDNVSQWNGTSVGNAIVALMPRLQAAGFNPDVIAPSCSSMGNNINYFNGLAAVGGAVDYLTELSYHRYGQSYAQLLQIVSQAEQYGLQMSMLEWWSDSNGHETLHEDLAVGLNSAWQQGVIAGASPGGTVNNGMSLYIIDTADPDNPVIEINKKTRILRQYYVYARPGAVRIDAATADPSFEPLAFVNAGGDYVVVVKADTGGEIPIQGLPDAEYSATYASAVDYNNYDTDLPIEAFGGVVTVDIPEAGVVTIHE